MINEKLPLPLFNLCFTNNIINGLNVTYLQYFRINSSDNGTKMIVNNINNAFLPDNIFNYTNTNTNNTFPNGNSVTIANSGIYLHNIIISGFSTNPINGMFAFDIVNTTGTIIAYNAVSVKNITPLSTDPLILILYINHNINDNLRLRFLGGTVPDGADLELNIISINWSIIQIS